MSSPQSLPIHHIIPQLREVLRNNEIVILQAAPGAGKSTVVPVELMNEEWLQGNKVVMLEPRRLAARAVSERMADSINEKPGEQIGYSIRFESNVSNATKVEVVTEGLLARRILQDEFLEGVGLLIFDEFHERNLHADFALTLALEIRKLARPDLRILIMSATIDAGQLRSWIGKAEIINCEGRQYPITLNYVPENINQNLPRNCADLVLRAFSETKGDILVFLPGAGEIKRTQELLETKSLHAVMHPLYGDLSFSDQQRALLPDSSGLRKIVLATSIAETSLTIEGITTVVDCGYSRIPHFDPETETDQLVTVRVSADTADQRAGRAGRLGPGTCYRMWSETIQMHLQQNRKPEILNCDVTQMLLGLASLGYSNSRELNWITSPSEQSLQYGYELLTDLDAITDSKITAHGKAILNLPAHPRIAHMLLKGVESGNGILACDIAALLEERDPMNADSGVDLTLRIEELYKWRNKERFSGDRNRFERINRISQQWQRILKLKPSPQKTETYAAGKLVAAVYPDRIAFRQSGNQYRLANGQKAALPEHDALIAEKWIAIAHMHTQTHTAKIFFAAPLNEEDVIHLAKERTRIEWNESDGGIVARRETYIGGIVLRHRQITDVSPSEIERILFDVVKSQGYSLLNWNEETRQLQLRIALVRKYFPEADLPDFSSEALLSQPENWIAPYLSGVKRKDDLSRIDLFNALKNLLSWEQQSQLNELVPESITVPSGSNIKIAYQENDAQPVLAVRLQEVFGWTETPAILKGRVKLMLHLLSPAYRPVQVTQDLSSFWTSTYSEVRKEMRSRYPKHSWPEDPWTAVAVRGVKRKN